MRNWLSFRRFRDDERGATAIEYSLILGFIGMSVLAAFVGLGGSLAALWEDNILPEVQAAFASAGV